MANLIITIISIALVAVAALMGAYYGGSAFLQGQAKANANTLIAQGEQIVAAWSIHAADRNGNWAALTNVTGLTTSTPAYLASVPRPPSGVTSTVNDWTLANLSSIGSGTANGVYLQLTNDTVGGTLCTLVSQMIAGSSASPTWHSVATNIIESTAAQQRKFGCGFFHATVSVMDAASHNKFVYYRAY